MSVPRTPTLDELMALPWSREILADEDGVFLARVPELPGCFADGDTPELALRALEDVLRDWLAIALEEERPVPDPRRVSDDYSGRFSVRVPRSLHRSLSERAEAEGCSLNQLVASLLAQGVGPCPPKLTGDASVSDRKEVHETIAADAVSTGSQSIGALKGIAAYLRDNGDINLACLLFSVAAARIAAGASTEEASREIGATAALARQEGRIRLAEALWRESLQYDPTNLRSASALGQLLHHQGRFAEACVYLERASSVDNHAKLFLGWSRLREAMSGDERQDPAEPLGLVVDALRSWAYQNRTASERSSWLRHVARLRSIGVDADEVIDQLVGFANANARWGHIDVTEIESVEQPVRTAADDASTYRT